MSDIEPDINSQNRTDARPNQGDDQGDVYHYDFDAIEAQEEVVTKRGKVMAIPKRGKAKIRIIVSISKWMFMRSTWNEMFRRSTWNEMFMRSIWNKMFTCSCVIAVLSDPLFFYIPIVKDDMKCLVLDHKLKRVTLALRSVTDLFYMLDVIFEISNLSKFYAVKKKNKKFYGTFKTAPIIYDMQFPMEKKKSAEQTSLLCILIDIFALMPIPQVITLVFFSKVGGLRSSTRMVLNSLILFQCVPRLLRIYLLGKSHSRATQREWNRAAVFNFLPFILTSHMLGAIWYSFGIQRTTACWEYGCQGQNKCKLGMFDCNGNSARRNILLINGVCNVKNSSDAALFNFGIFLDGVRSGVLESTNFSQKLWQCFWWGLRNLSSFGSNLQTSSYTLENLFVVMISISGILLFIIYINAGVQAYMQFAEERAKKLAKKLEFKQKMRMLNPDIDMWLYKNDLPRRLKGKIMENVQKYIEEDKDVDVENILSILPLRHKRPVLEYLHMASLKTVPMLEKLNVRVLKALSGHLKRVTYNEDSYIFREGEPLEKMLFITQGSAWSYPTSNTNIVGSTIDYSIIKCLKKGDFYGDELLIWAIKSALSSQFPISTRIVKSQTKVEAFAIRANDLKRVVYKYWRSFRLELGHLQDFQREHWENLAACSLQDFFRPDTQAENDRVLQWWRKAAFQY